MTQKHIFIIIQYKLYHTHMSVVKGFTAKKRENSKKNNNKIIIRSEKYILKYDKTAITHVYVRQSVSGLRKLL